MHACRVFTAVHRSTRNRGCLSYCRFSERVVHQAVPHCPPTSIQGSDCYASLSVSTEQLIVTYFRQTRTTAVILISTFLHALGFFAGTYYLPVYFQVIGSSATIAGVR